MLLSLISLTAFAVVAYGLYDNLDNEIKKARLELDGIEQIKPIPAAIQAMQKHRGRWVAVLDSNGAVWDDHEEVDKRADLAFKALEKSLHPGLRGRKDWQDIKKGWEQLENEESSMTATESFATHTRIIEQLSAFKVVIADEYALTLDSQIDTYYLIDTAINKLPSALEHIGQLRAYGTGILVRKHSTAEQKKEVYKIIGMLEDALVALDINLKKTAHHNPLLQDALLATSSEIAGSVRKVVHLMESDILAERFNTAPKDFFDLSTRAIDQSYLQLYESLLPATEALLKERIARAENMLHTSIGIALLLLLIVIYFAIGIYFSIISNVQSLAHSASIFANGDLNERIHLDTHDELRQVGDSFNEMADGFGALLEARKRDEESLRKSHAEQMEMNQKLEESRNHLLQSEKMASIGQLAAGVAHEINNPIGYVYSNLGTLEQYVRDTFGMLDQYAQAEGAISDDVVLARLKAAREKLDIEFLKEDLGALMTESRDGITRVKQIVQNLKDFSHVDATDEWHFADLHKGLDSTLNIVNNEIKYKASVIKEYGVIPEVECLSSQLNQVFMNLLVNAAHAIEGRGTITLRTGSQGDKVWVEIADTGKGIAPEHMQKIFEPFFTTKPIGKGTGLGLSLSYGIIQKHHGHIEVQSEVGKGTTFRVWLPVKQMQDDEKQ